MTVRSLPDIPYEPVFEPNDPATKRAYWNAAFGLQRVDELEPSRYAVELAREHVEGARSLEETGELIRGYHRGRDEGSNASEREADLVSQRIVELLSSKAFLLAPDMLSIVHHRLFQDLDEDVYQPGRFKTSALMKREPILNGDSVVYADPSLVQRSLELLFDDERGRSYSVEFDDEDLRRFVRFVARVWQVHPFVEGNTRTVAVFSELYLNDLGFDVSNEPFESSARYFRDALVRANYRNAKAGVQPDSAFLEAFFQNLVHGAGNELRSRDLVCRALFENPGLLRNVSPSEAFSLKEDSDANPVDGECARAVEAGIEVKRGVDGEARSPEAR